MASSTKKSENIRKRHHRKCGKEARRTRRNKGSTPAFPIHLPQHAVAPAAEAQS